MNSQTNDRQFLSSHVHEFRRDVLCDLDIDDLFLLFSNEHCDLGLIIYEKYLAWRRSYEDEAAIHKVEVDMDRAAYQRERI